MLPSSNLRLENKILRKIIVAFPICMFFILSTLVKQFLKADEPFLSHLRNIRFNNVARW